MSSNLIPDKPTFLALYNAGLLGNRTRTWPSYQAMRNSGYEGQLTIRSHDKQSPWTVLCTSTDCPCGCDGIVNDCCNESDCCTEVEGDLAEILMKSRLPESAFYLQEVPTHGTLRIANIEAMLDPSLGGMYMHLEAYTTEAVRGIRERTKPRFGVNAWLTLKNTISEESYEMLQDLWAKYPTAIIEATEFSRAVGTLHKRLVIWEVRTF